MKCVCHEHKTECDCLKAADMLPDEETRRSRWWLWFAWLVIAAAAVVILLGKRAHSAEAEDVPPGRWCPVYRLWAATRAPLALPRGARSSYMLTSPAAERICLEQGTKEEAARKAAPHSPKAR